MITKDKSIHASTWSPHRTRGLEQFAQFVPPETIRNIRKTGLEVESAGAIGCMSKNKAEPASCPITCLELQKP